MSTNALTSRFDFASFWCKGDEARSILSFYFIIITFFFLFHLHGPDHTQKTSPFKPTLVLLGRSVSCSASIFFSFSFLPHPYKLQGFLVSATPIKGLNVLRVRGNWVPFLSSSSSSSSPFFFFSHSRHLLSFSFFLILVFVYTHTHTHIYIYILTPWFTLCRSSIAFFLDHLHCAVR